MPDTIRPLPHPAATPSAQPAGRTWLRRTTMAATALLAFAILVGALHGLVGDPAIATMLAGVAAITAAPFLGGRSGGGRAS